MYSTIRMYSACSIAVIVLFGRVLYKELFNNYEGDNDKDIEHFSEK